MVASLFAWAERGRTARWKILENFRKLILVALHGIIMSQMEGKLGALKSFTLNNQIVCNQSVNSALRRTAPLAIGEETPDWSLSSLSLAAGPPAVFFAQSIPSVLAECGSPG
jgi:hypothetical protein